MEWLYQRSLEILLAHQASGGAYLACPNFRVYQYGWFRDGSFCAHALDRCGHGESAQRFFQWTMEVIQRYAGKIRSGIRMGEMGSHPREKDILHARFTLEGLEVPGYWGNHQLDGLGTWLWALHQHFFLNPHLDLPPAWREAVTLVREYLIALWRLPCSDIWEEHEDQQHTYTLATLSAGLRSLAAWLGDERAGQMAQEIGKYILANSVANGCLVKSIGSREVDANLVALATPYRVLPLDDPRMLATIHRIESELIGHAGGLRRYPQDCYYGGGEWLVLYAWLGWAYAEAGRLDSAEAILQWLEAQANPNGELPEQVQERLNFPEEYDPWVKRWGPVATPLLWSHAMYLILKQAIRDQRISQVENRAQ